jgi:hypothetical protein
VAEICRRLDGIPLALELAAARLAHFTVHELADGLGDALTLLRTARDVDAWIASKRSPRPRLEPWAARSGEEQMIFRRLAVFAGGFDLEAAASVCECPGPVVIDLVSRLVDKSLVHADTGRITDAIPVARGGSAVRGDAPGQAEEVAGCRKRHLEWYAGPLAAHDPDRGEVVVGEPSGWFDVEQDNLRAALATALTTDPTTAHSLHVLLALLG